MKSKKQKELEIQSIINAIAANKSIAQDHPELKEKLENFNITYEKELEELKKKPVKTKRIITNSDQEKVTLGKCKAVVGSTDKPCCNSEASDGYCLIHLKQRDPQKAEEYQRIMLKNKFGLTDLEVDKIKEANGTLENVSKGLAVFIKSSRSSQ